MLPDPLLLLDEPEQIEKEAEAYTKLVRQGYREALEGREDKEVVLGEAELHRHERYLLSPPEELYFSPQHFANRCAESDRFI